MPLSPDKRLYSPGVVALAMGCSVDKVGQMNLKAAIRPKQIIRSKSGREIRGYSAEGCSIAFRTHKDLTIRFLELAAELAIARHKCDPKNLRFIRTATQQQLLDDSIEEGKND